MRWRTEGVSESLGYLIIFGLVLSGIALITLYGYPMLMQQESSANLRNMEQTMIVLQNDIKSLTYKLANYKETTLRVSGGSLFSKISGAQPGGVDTPQKFRILSSDWCGTDWCVPESNFYPGELRYLSTKDNTVITLENGAVIMKPLGENGSVMLAEPRWYIDADPNGRQTLVINYVSLGNWTANHRITNLSQTGVGTVRMSQKQTLVWSSPVNRDVIIEYYPDNKNTIMPDGYAVAWKTFLTDKNALNMEVLSQPPATPYYQFRNLSPLSSIVVKEYDIMVETL